MDCGLKCKTFQGLLNKKCSEPFSSNLGAWFWILRLRSLRGENGRRAGRSYAFSRRRAIEAALELAVARGFRENKHETPNKKYRCEEEGEASSPTVFFRPVMAQRGATMRGGGINPRRDPNTRKTMVKARISWLGYERGSTDRS